MNWATTLFSKCYSKSPKEFPFGLFLCVIGLKNLSRVMMVVAQFKLSQGFYGYAGDGLGVFGF